MKHRGIFLLAASLIWIAAFAQFAASADTADQRCDQLFTALRDGNFPAVTAHFDPVMKAALSSDQLGQVWIGIVAGDGKLLKWEVIQRGKISGIDVRSVELSFEHGKQISTVSVRPGSGEIAGLYFRPVMDTHEK
jgi:hypothetical protein